MIDIIIPVYNEADNIGRCLEEIGGKIKSEKCVYIIYDFENDDTVPAVNEIIKNSQFDFSVKLLKNKFESGPLNAIRTGIYESKNGAVLIVMADLSDDLSIADEMYSLLSPQKGEGADIVCGSRYMKGGRQIGGPLVKRSLSRLAGLSLHYIIGIPTHDATNSFKMYKRHVFEKMEIESRKGFELGLEMVVKAYFAYFEIVEIPTVWHDRTIGNSRFKLFSFTPYYLKWYIFAFKNKIRLRFA